MCETLPVGGRAAGRGPDRLLTGDDCGDLVPWRIEPEVCPGGPELPGNDGPRGFPIGLNGGTGSPFGGPTGFRPIFFPVSIIPLPVGDGAPVT